MPYVPPPPEKISEEEIKRLMEKAQEAFWQVIAERFPNCPGDFSPDATHHMDEYMKGLIRLWINWNVPGNEDIFDQVEE